MELPTLLPSAVRPATGPVHHYTSAAGLVAVVASGKIWASEASSLNDRAEVRQGWESIQAQLQSYQDSRAATWLMDYANTPTKKANNVFILCASTRADDANQWRLYADAGRGYSIEFDSSIQLAAFSEKPLTPDDEKRARSSKFVVTRVATVTPWMHVLYTPDEIARAVDELVTLVDARLRNVDEAPDDEAQQFFSEQLQDDAYQALESIAHLIKSEGFSGENEVRVVATFLWGRDHVGYRASPNGVAGYAVLTAAPKGRGHVVCGPPYKPSLPIHSVRLGPLLAPENGATVRALLRQHELEDADVGESAVPLR